MSYDLYCYRSTSDLPDASEAVGVVELFNERDEQGAAPIIPEMREKIVAALKQHDPQLEQFQFDVAAIARNRKISDAEARESFQHAELNTPEGRLTIQITVYGDIVTIAVPYWYSGKHADDVFAQVSAYLRVIRNAAGLVAYDPQTDLAFDPEFSPLTDHGRYDEVVRKVPTIAAEAAKRATKPWWKFWQ